MTESNIKSWFAVCGIYPFNPLAIPSEAFLPNYLYSIEQILTNPDAIECPVVIDSTEIQNENIDIGNCINNGSSANTITLSAMESVTTTSNNVRTEAESSKCVRNSCNNGVFAETAWEALKMGEDGLEPDQLTTYKYLYIHGLDLLADKNFTMWKTVQVNKVYCV